MRFIIYCVTLLFFCQASFGQVDSVIVSAQTAYDNQEYALAYEKFNKCFTEDSTLTNCCEKVAMSAYRLGDVPKAKSVFLHLLKIDSTNRRGLNQLAVIYEQEKNSPKSIKYYTQLNKLYPENGLYFRKLGQQYSQSGLLLDAFYYYNQAYTLNKKDMLSLQGLVEILLRNEQYSDADSLLLIGLERDSLNIKMNQQFARSKYKQKDFENTIKHLSRVNGKVDLNPYFNKMLGYSYIQIDSFETAIFFLEKSLMDNGSKEHAHYYLATAYEKLENYEFAEHHYKKALEEAISDNTSTYHRNLAIIYKEENNLKEAIPHYKDAYKYKADPKLLYILGVAADDYYKDKNIAIRYYQKYLKSNHKNADYRDYCEKRIRYLKEVMHQNR